MTTSLKALVKYGVVENVILVGSDWVADEEFTAIQINESDAVGPGWTYDGEAFSPPVVEVIVPPKRVSKADFQRLLTPSERYAINALRREIAGLLPADYADPSNALLVAAEDVLFAFEQPLEFIELDHADTYAGLMLLSYLDVLTESRVTEITGG